MPRPRSATFKRRSSTAPVAQPRVGSVQLPLRSVRHYPGGCGRGAAEPAGPTHRVRELSLGSATKLPTSPAASVGTVLASVPGFPLGSFVYAECHAAPGFPGALGAHVIVDDDDVLPLPDGVDPVLAAAVGKLRRCGLPAADPGCRLAGGRGGPGPGCHRRGGAAGHPGGSPEGQGDRRRPRSGGAGTFAGARREWRGQSAPRRKC